GYGYSALLFQALEVQTQVFYTCTPFLGPTAQAISKPVVAGLKKFSGSSLTTPATSYNRSSVVQSNTDDMQDLRRPHKNEKTAGGPDVTMNAAHIENLDAPSPVRSIPRGAGVRSFSAGTANSSASSLGVVDEESGTRGLSPPTPPRSSL